jgi:hypothetical protein
MKYFFFLSLSIVFFVSSAQPFTVSTSEEIELKNNTSSDKVLAINQDEACLVTARGVYLWYPSPDQISLNFVKGNTLVRTVPLKGRSDNDRYIDAYINNGQIGYFCVAFNKSADKMDLSYRTVDNNGNIKKLTPLYIIDGEKDYLGAPGYYFNTRQSFDKKKLLLMNVYDDKVEKAIEINFGQWPMPHKSDECRVTVIDENGGLYFSKTLDHAAAGKVTIVDYDVNGAGDVFILAKEHIDGKFDSKKGEVNYNMFIYAVTNKGTAFKKIPLDINDYFSPGPKLIVSNKGTIYCGGLLSEKAGHEFVGVFTLKLDMNANSANIKISKINTDQLKEFRSKVHYKNNEISEFFVVDGIVETKDGIGIIAEFL